jgi:hypothetical protein
LVAAIFSGLLVVMLLGPQRAAAAVPAETHYLFVFANPVAGHEAEFNQEYDETHAPDVVSIPGFVSAQRYVYADHQLREVALKKPSYLVVYKIVANDLGAVFAEIGQRMKDGRTRPQKWVDPKSFQNFTYRVSRPTIAGAGGQPADAAKGPTAVYHQFVFAHAKQGMDAEYDTWYDRYHLPEMIRTPGFTVAQRLELAATQMTPQEGRQKFLADFVIETPDIAAVFREFGKRARTMTMSPAFDGDQTFGYTYKAIGPALSGDAIRAARAKQ